jgi:voltage-gated potassium channel
MTASPAPAARHGNAYNIFILVLTVISLVVMVLLFLPLRPATLALLAFYDNLICLIFLLDFALNFKSAPSKRHYLIGERGWLDLLGSIPTFGILRATAILRLARLSRFARILRLLRGQNKKQLVDDVLHNRAHYAVFITILAAMLVLTMASAVVLQAEGRSADANITTGWNAFWWSFVTITTVGYGDYYPVTVPGRVGAMFIMVTGIGIIGALASIMASLIVGSGSSESNERDDGSDTGSPSTAPAGSERDLIGLQQELAGVRDELAGMRRELAALRGLSLSPAGAIESTATRATEPSRGPNRGDGAQGDGP